MSDKLSKILTVLALLGLVVGLGGCKDNGGNPHSTYTYQSVYSQSAAPNPAPVAPVPSADNVPVLPGDALPTGNQECVLNLNPPGTGISMRDSLNIQGNADVICKAQPTLIWVSMRLQMQNPHGGWDDEADVLIDPHPPAPRTINGVLFFTRSYNRWAACFPGWWRVVISWNGVKNTAGSSRPETFGADLVPAAPLKTNCTM